MLRHKIAILSLALCLGGSMTVAAQDLEPKSIYLTVFTHADWKNISEEKQAVESVYSEALSRLRSNAHVSHVKFESEIFRGRNFNITEEQLPVIRLQFKNGGIIKQYSSGGIPSASSLHAGLKSHYQAALDLQTSETAVIEEPIYEGRILDLLRNKDSPDKSGLLKDKPIRTTLAWSTYLVVGACVLAGLMLMLLISSPFILFFCYLVAVMLKAKSSTTKEK